MSEEETVPKIRLVVLETDFAKRMKRTMVFYMIALVGIFVLAVFSQWIAVIVALGCSVISYWTYVKWDIHLKKIEKETEK